MILLCSVCNTLKPKEAFCKNKNSKRGYTAKCKICEQIYRRLPKNKLSKMYSSQKLHSKRRGHLPPQYTKEDFITWAMNNNYMVLHINWVNNGYQRRFAPSADRVDDTKPYALDNIHLTTWGYNDDKAHEDFKTGKLVNTHTAVGQYNKDGTILIKVHPSQLSAARCTGASQGNIGMVCRGIRKHTKGFQWRYMNG